MISCSNIHYRYGKTKVLQNLSIKLQEGKTHGIMGTNGSGKTTLAKILSGLTPLKQTGEKAFPTKKCMLIQQDFAIWPEVSVLNNIQIAANKHDSMLWLERVQLHDKSRDLAKTLSHGQKQRLSIARALASRPEVLILDEAFSYLDPVLKNSAYQWLRLAQQESVQYSLFISQSMEEIFTLCDSLSFLTNGSLSEPRSPESCYKEPANFTEASLTGSIQIIPSTIKHCLSNGNPILQEQTTGELTSNQGQSHSSNDTEEHAQYVIRPEHLVSKPIQGGQFTLIRHYYLPGMSNSEFMGEFVENGAETKDHNSSDKITAKILGKPQVGEKYQITTESKFLTL